MMANKTDNSQIGLDTIDRKLLRELQRNSKITNTELAKLVNLSPTPCLERVKRLQEQGYIERYTAILNPDKLGYNLLAFIEITLDRTNRNVFDEFAVFVKQIDAIQECHMIAGGFDYLVKARFKTMKEYRQFLGTTFGNHTAILSTKTYVVMESVKENSPLAIVK